MSDTQRGSITPGPKGRYTTFFLFHKNAVHIVNWTRPEQPTLWPINCSAPMITDNITLISTGPQLMLFQELQILLILLLCRVLQWGFWGLGNKGHLSKMLRRGVQVRVFNFTFSGKKPASYWGSTHAVRVGKLRPLSSFISEIISLKCWCTVSTCILCQWFSTADSWTQCHSLKLFC